MDVSDVRKILREHGLEPRPRMGQHFLVDDRVADRIVDRADGAPGEAVLEIGPGLGVLTTRLVDAFDRVIAVEKDRRLAEVVRERAPGAEIVVGDALDVDLPEVDAVVANLPYQISSPVTFRLLDHGFDRAVLTYQHAFAERLCAGPGGKDYGRLTVNAAVRADREIVETVPRSAFWPRPEVDGAVVRLRWRSPDFEIADMDTFEEVVRAMFSHRRKTSRNAVRLHADRLGGEELVDAATAEWGLGDRRPAKLGPEEIADLANRIARAAQQPP